MKIVLTLTMLAMMLVPVQVYAQTAVDPCLTIEDSDSNTSFCEFDACVEENDLRLIRENRIEELEGTADVEQLDCSQFLEGTENEATDSGFGFIQLVLGAVVLLGLSTGLILYLQKRS